MSFWDRIYSKSFDATALKFESLCLDSIMTAVEKIVVRRI